MKYYLYRLAILVVGVTVLALAMVGLAKANSAPPFLSDLSSRIVGHDVTIYCATSQREWARDVRLGVGPGEKPNFIEGFALISEDVAYLSPRVCQELIRAHNGYGDPFLSGEAIVTYLHETVHLYGWHNEGKVECFAMKNYLLLATTVFHYRKGTERYRQLRFWARYWHLLRPAQYRTC